MPTVRVPVMIEHPLPGGPAMNVWHFRIGGSLTEDSYLHNALDALAAFYEPLRGFYPGGTTITIGSGMIADPLGNPTYVDDDITVLHGESTAPNTATLLQVVASWRTTSATRSGRGRTFIGPLNASVVQGDGTIDPDKLNLIRGAVSGLVEDSQTANFWAVGVLSVKDGALRPRCRGAHRPSR